MFHKHIPKIIKPEITDHFAAVFPAAAFLYIVVRFMKHLSLVLFLHGLFY